jgi:alkylhydroperoxidase domain protein
MPTHHDTAPLPGPPKKEAAMAEHIITHPGNEEPRAFTQAELDWLPWLEPLGEGQLTDRHWAGLVDRSRAKSPYFMLLAHDPDILGARTRTDKDIFYNTRDGLPRAERELSAAATSRLNGCIYCASVHARFATQFSRRGEDVQRLLDEGVGTRIDPRWDALVAASVALAETPSAFGAAEIARLREAGLDDLEIADAIHGAAFFNWANRLMLSLGEPAARG